jgi:5-methylcytosine-specific restriction endonuclease McrA
MAKVPKCPSCQEENPQNFWKDRRYGEDNYQTYCKECSKERRRGWSSRNRDKVREYHKDYHAKIKNDPVKWQAQLARRAQLRAYYRLVDQVSDANRRAKKYGAKGKITLKQWRTLILEHPECPGCKEPWVFVGKPELDHIIALKKRGKNKIENIQPLCQSCHSRKILSTRRFGKKKKKRQSDEAI